MSLAQLQVQEGSDDQRRAILQCRQDPRGVDPKVIYWNRDQENVERGLEAGQLIEVYGE